MLIKIPKKKKLSIDFEWDNYDLLVRFANEQKISNSQVINFLIENLLSLSNDAKRRYAQSTTEQLSLLRQKYSGCQDLQYISVLQRFFIFQ